MTSANTRQPGATVMPAQVMARDLAAGGQTTGWITPQSVLRGEKSLLIGNPNSAITRITVVQQSDVASGHWEIYLDEAVGRSVKIDLMEAGYRVLYNAAPRFGTDGTSESITLNPQKLLHEVLRAVAEIADNAGEWTGSDKYNCQDFVLFLMARLGVAATQIFKYELRRVATKNRGILIHGAGGDVRI